MNKRTCAIAFIAVATLLPAGRGPHLQAQSCNFTVAPSALSLSEVGGSGLISVVTSGASCGWTANSEEAWGLFLSEGKARLETVNTELYQSGSVNVLSGTTTVSDGQWHYIAATWNGGVLKLFVDGVLDATGILNGTLLTNNQPVVIGH